MSIATAKEIILRKVPGQIYLAHIALGIYQSIGQHAKELNRSKFRDLFWAVQHHALASLILSLCKAFETPKSYSLFSIPVAIAHLKKSQGLKTTNTEECRELLASAQTFVNIVGYGFVGFSADSVVERSAFEAQKSQIWCQIERLVGVVVGMAREDANPPITV
ncbi:MAG: hypothetical protein HY706_06775 [Candidatus Hydrogenedentes bacterium]|nr:hypothetical protein [Candidatus Hydrogenedentota bacterium]